MGLMLDRQLRELSEPYPKLSVETMKLFINTVNRLKEFIEIFSQLAFTKNLVSYADLNRFWESLFYISAICGAAFILAAKLPLGVLFVLCSFLCYRKSFRYEFGVNKKSELTSAIYYRDVKYLKHILENRSDPNQTDGFGHSPLLLAIQHGGNSAGKMIDLLVQHGARLTDNGKRKPLEEAIRILKDSDTHQSTNSAISVRNLNLVKQIIEAEDTKWSDSDQFVEFLVEHDVYDRLVGFVHAVKNKA